MARGRPKKKIRESSEEVEIKVVDEKPKEESPLFARQKQLLDLIQAMKNEGAQDVGYLEVLLSRVNQQIAEL